MNVFLFLSNITDSLKQFWSHTYSVFRVHGNEMGEKIPQIFLLASQGIKWQKNFDLEVVTQKLRGYDAAVKNK